ncbi:MAG: hypothetical protein RLY97_1985 [Pseudomonadota bacterium]|jgi:hypothetical protein
MAGRFGGFIGSFVNMGVILSTSCVGAIPPEKPMRQFATKDFIPFTEKCDRAMKAKFSANLGINALISVFFQRLLSISTLPQRGTDSAKSLDLAQTSCFWRAISQERWFRPFGWVCLEGSN